MTPKQFYDNHIGKKFNRGAGWNDSSFGYQCVAAFKRFLEITGIGAVWTPSGYASGYWEYRDKLGFSKNFDYITDKNQFRDGDWIIWNKGARDCPYSHIAMYYQGKCFSQNQGSNEFTLKALSFDGVYGALRYRYWESEKVSTPALNSNYQKLLDELANRVLRGEFGNGEDRKNNLGAIYQDVQYLVNKKLGG